ncbi:uncharacterized protein LOC130979950 [Arachis stenosperma]|uniref:uncharacterized protein LOC130979950 n=1 Tax=Arachis stenosperma TaxID=217475 RepID=UPI0025ACBB06|nr:uncharacterized protein LOC130979950 [Arachis stenosperma]
MTRSLPNPSLAPFDSEIERTLLHIRQARRQLVFEEGEKVFTNSPTISSSSNEGTNYSSVDTTNSFSFDLGFDNMAAPRRVTLKEVGAPDFVPQPLHVLHPNLNANFELKTTLIHLLPKFHGLPAQDPIRHLKDFHGVCSTTRREGSDEVAIWLFAFPFSLEGRAKEWFYTLPSDVVSDWDLLRREFLDKFMPVEMTAKLRKEISCIVQGEMETLYEYWERFRKLLDSCPNHMINTQVLLSYVCQGMREQDKNLLDASRNSSLSKYRTAEEAWQLITNLAESTQHARRRVNCPKAVNEVSSSGYHNQGYPQQGGNYSQGSNNSNQGWRDSSNQSWRDNYQQGGRDNGGNQRWNNNTSQHRYSQNPPNQQPNQGRNYQTYIPPHRQPLPPNQPQAPQITYPSTSPNQDDTLRSILQGQKELQNTLNSSLNGLTSTLQALIARMEPPSIPTLQASTSSAIPSQPLPNPKGGINAVTLRSGMQLKERDSKAPNPMKVAQEKDGVEIEEIEEEEESHVIVEDEDPQPRSEVPRKGQILEEVAQPIPFPTLARKAKKRVELDPTMVKMFKKVEVTIPLFDAIQ